jgi:MFS family permease
VVYGALYVSFIFQGLFLQNTLGYTALAAGAAGLPVGIMLALFSTPVGGLAGRYGPRRFLAAGPTLMALGSLWFARIPATSQPWLARIQDPASLLPTSGYLIDVLPGGLLFGAGLTLLVAPLTTAVMGSVPTRRAGLASAINNAVSRVGAPLISAVIFIAIVGSFYSGLEARVPGLDASQPEVRRAIPPLNPPAESVPDDQQAAARDASTDAFHLAMLVAALLLFTGAAVAAVGLRERPSEGTGETAREGPGAAETAPGPAG